MPLNRVSAVYINCIGHGYSLYCNVGGFVIGQPINPYNMDGLVFTELAVSSSITLLTWCKKDSPRGAWPSISLGKTNGRPLKLLEKFNKIKNRKMW